MAASNLGTCFKTR